MQIRRSSSSPPRVRQGSRRLGLGPAGRFVDQTRPLFTWPRQPSATYVVSIFLNREEVLRSGRLTTPRWRPDHNLRRGQTYAWQVEITRDCETTMIPASPAPPALFRIVPLSQHREIESALASHPDDHFLHAVLYGGRGWRKKLLRR